MVKARAYIGYSASEIITENIRKLARRVGSRKRTFLTGTEPITDTFGHRADYRHARTPSRLPTSSDTEPITDTLGHRADYRHARTPSRLQTRSDTEPITDTLGHRADYRHARAPSRLPTLKRCLPKELLAGFREVWTWLHGQRGDKALHGGVDL